MNVRIIPEDEPKDKFILKPLIEAMLKKLGKGNACVKVHRPQPSGWPGVCQWGQVRQILDDFPDVGLFILCVDRDGHVQRRGILNRLEERSNRILEARRRLFVAEHAWQEIEVWALAGTNWKLKPTWLWDAIRAERDSKERFFEPFVRDRGLLDSPGSGRQRIGEEAGRNYAKVRQNCDEIRDLETRIGTWLRGSGFS
jgi:hypothetical protein